MTPSAALDATVCDTALALTCDTLDQLRDVYLARDVTFRRKADGSVVSATDQHIHARFADAIAATFDGHELISEEGTHESGDARFRWIIDPLDGTSNFTSGLPYWCVSVALTCDGQVVMGVVDAPDLNVRYAARAGGGTWASDGKNQKRVWVREPVDVFDEKQRQVPLMLTPTTLVSAREHNVALRQRVLGATALDLAFVADGTAAGSVAVVPRIWDVAAGVLLVHEAGGAVAVEPDVLLPVTTGVDYGSRQGAVVAGGSETAVRQLASVALPASRASVLTPLSFGL